MRFIGLLALALVSATVTGARGTPAHDSQARNGDWIAFSTAPHGDQASPGPPPAYVAHAGSDVFIAREGGRPILVASRGAGRTWNACPTFSPDGTKLAFGTESRGWKSISVVRVTRAGVSAAQRVKLSVRGGNWRAPCPLWSADGSRLAYEGLGGRVVVRGLAGSTLRARAGDPVKADFAARNDDTAPLVSPAGDLVARLRQGYGFSCSVLVERPDGSGGRVVPVARRTPSRCPYSFAAWSPDGRRLLLMYDVTGRDFTMFAVPISVPFKRVSVVERVRVNHGRSWPGRGDVSWQPRPY